MPNTTDRTSIMLDAGPTTAVELTLAPGCALVQEDASVQVSVAGYIGTPVAASGVRKQSLFP